MRAFVPLSRLHRPETPWFVRQRELIDEPPERVWRALTTPTELAGWWCNRADVDLTVGGHVSFSGPSVYGDAEPTATSRCEILDITENERIEFAWELRGVPTRLLIELAPVIEGSEVVVTQTANSLPAWAPGEGSHNWWSVALPALRSYLERGEAALRPDYSSLRAAVEPTYRVAVTNYPWLIWSKLTEPRELDRWIGTGSRIDLRPGGAYELGPGPGPRTALEIEPEKLLVTDWHEPELPIARMSWRIEEGELATLVTLTDHGPRPQAESRDQKDRRIFRCLGSILHLKQLAERGMTPREYQEG